jgi:hypothetical protein
MEIVAVVLFAFLSVALALAGARSMLLLTFAVMGRRRGRTFTR